MIAPSSGTAPSGIDRNCQPSDTTASIGRPLGFALFLAVMLVPGIDLATPQKIVLGTGLWMAAWWISGAVPLYVTAFLPLLIFPAATITPFPRVAAYYADRLVFMLMGGFILAKAIEKTGLHERFALATLRIVPNRKPAMVVGAFMLVTAAISAWLCNTATTLMILPIALAVVSQVRSAEHRDEFASCLMLAVAYAAALGGVATLIGTPPNALCASISAEMLGVEIPFFRWALAGAPVASVGLVVVGWYLTHIAFPMAAHPAIESRHVIDAKLAALGSMPRDQKVVLGVFAATAFAWLSHFAWQSALPQIDDAMIAMIAATALFLLPSAHEGARILEADEGVRLPWGVLLVIGGGIALASGLKTTQLDSSIAQHLVFLETWPSFLVVALLVATAMVMTQFMVNTAVAALLLPVAASLAQVITVDPRLLLIPVAVATSLAFVLPIGSPPNMVVLGSGHVSTKQMARAGIPLAVILWIVVTVVLYGLISAAF